MKRKAIMFRAVLALNLAQDQTRWRQASLIMADYWSYAEHIPSLRKAGFVFISRTFEKESDEIRKIGECAKLATETLVHVGSEYDFAVGQFK